MTSTQTVGQRIRAQRTRQKLDLKRAADSIGISLPYLSRIERDERNPPYRTLERIAAGLGVSLRSIIPPGRTP